MKQGMKYVGILSAVLLFCAVGVWLEAIDIKGTYQKAKEAVNSVYREDCKGCIID